MNRLSFVQYFRVFLSSILKKEENEVLLEICDDIVGDIFVNAV